MNHLQFLLLKLAEEANEVAIAIIEAKENKPQQFLQGSDLDEIHFYLNYSIDLGCVKMVVPEDQFLGVNHV